MSVLQILMIFMSTIDFVKFFIGKPSKKNYEISDIVRKGGGVSTAAKLFIEKKYGHVYSFFV